MALRGETVGTAYVRILADGGGLPQSIKDEMRSTEPAARKGGEDISRAFHEGYNAESKRNQTMEKGLVAKFDRAFGQIEARGVTMSRNLQEKIRANVVKGLRDIDPDVAEDVGRRVAQSMADGFAKTGHLSGNISGEIDRALADIRRESDDWERDWHRTTNNITRDFFNTASDIGRNAGRIDNAMETVRVRVVNLGVSVARDADSVVRDMARIERAAETHLRRASGHTNNFAATMGKAFGKGARNNFVNLIGTMVGGLASLVSMAARAGSSLLGLGGKQAKVAASMEVAGAAATESAAEAAAAAGPVGWGALAAIIGGIVLLAPVAAGALSSLAGGVVALASSVSFALLGGLGAIAGLLPIIAFGAATVGAAFLGMSDDAKKALAESIKPIKDEFGELQKIAQKGIFAGIEKAGPKIANAMERAEPLIRGVSGAIGDVIKQFARAADSPGFSEFITAMQEFIPKAIRTIGRVATNVIGGLGGLFEGLSPSAMRFLEWLEKISKRFTDWANSPKGQNQIKDFMDKALVSTEKLWGLVKEVGISIGKLLFNDEGKKSGDSIIDDMTASVKDFNDWLDEHPDALNKWFEDGKDMAEDIGNAVDGIIKLFDTLDTPENREAARVIIKGLAVALEALSFMFEPVIAGFKLVGAASRVMWRLVRESAANMVDKFLGAVGAIVNGAAEAFGWVPGIGPKLKTAAAKFNTFRAEAVAAIRGIPKDVVINFSFSGGEKMKQQIADLQYEINKVPKSVTITILNKVQHIPTASGGLFAGPQVRLIGEAGPEAVVPLNRPLSQVDPAVRALSAVAQGKTSVTTNNNGRSIDVGGLTIITPTKDPAAVARETVNQLVASSYF